MKEQSALECLLHIEMADLPDICDLDLQPSAAQTHLLAGYLSYSAKLFTLSDVLYLTPDQLAAKLPYSAEECNNLIAQLSLLAVRQITRVDSCVLSTGDVQIDLLFNGGVPTGTITEISGFSGTGKTQFSLQLCLTAQLAKTHGGLGGGVVFMCTNSRFSIRRLKQMEKHIKARYPELENFEFADNIHVLHCRDLETQSHILKFKLASFVSTNNIKLVVIDSIATNFRFNDDPDHILSTMDRSIEIFTSMACLKALAANNNLAVVCINEFTADMQNGRIAIGKSAVESDTIYIQDQPKTWDLKGMPALGHSFGACVTTRCIFERATKKDLTRTMHIVFSPVAPTGSLNFEITERGIQGVRSDQFI